MSRRGRHLLMLLAVCCAFALSAAWAAERSASSAAAAEDDGTAVLKVGWMREPDNLNPFIGWENSCFEVWMLNYSFLFGFGVDEKPFPDLAAEIPTTENGGISADGKVWTIKLRPGLKWQDGAPLTADDVAFTYNYSIENELYAFQMMLVGIEKAEALDDRTVRITCSAPKADMLMLWVPILPKHVWSTVDPAKVESLYVNAPPLIGSGPYQVVEFRRGRLLRMVRNPSYHRGTPAVDEIVFVLYQNADTMAQDLKKGTIDAAWGLLRAQKKVLESAPGIETISYNYFNWDYLNFNCYDSPDSKGNPVLRDKRFRHALNYAVDRETLCRVAWSGAAKPATTIMPPGTWIDPDYHWQPAASELYRFDLAEAGRLLDAAGYRDTDGDGLREHKGKPIRLRLMALSENAQAQTEGKLITGWFKQLGLTIEFRVVDVGVLEDALWAYEGDTYAPDFDMYLWDWDGYNDPGQTLTTLTSAQIESWNEPCWSHEEYDALAAKQATTMDPGRRQQLIFEMQKLIYADTPWMALTYPDHLEAYNSDRWTGWTRVLGGNGPVIYSAGNVDTYLNLRPVAATESRSDVGVWVAAASGAAAVVIVVIALMVLRGRRRGRETEV